MRKYGRTDANHAAIVRFLRQIGAYVVDLSAMGGGVPDLLVGWRGRWFFIEVKVPGEDLTPAQVLWHAQAKERGLPVYVIETESQALALLEQMK